MAHTLHIDHRVKRQRKHRNGAYMATLRQCHPLQPVLFRLLCARLAGSDAAIATGSFVLRALARELERGSYTEAAAAAA